MTPTHSGRLRWGLLIAIGLIVFSIWRSGLLQELDLANLKARQDELTLWVSLNPWSSAAMFFALYVLVTAVSLPGATVLTVASGVLFGLAGGVLIDSFASSVGATLAFLSSRFVFRDWLRTRYGDRLHTFDQGVKENGAFYLFGLRLVPVIPFFMVNLLAGLTTLKTRTFYGVSQLGMLPGTVVYVYAGTQLATIESPRDIFSPGLIAAFVLLAASPFLMRGANRWLLTRRPYRGFSKPARFDSNLIVIGAGSGGLVASYIGSAIKAKVTLIERHQMGGDCLNTGCVPSKALIRSARLLAEARQSRMFGIARLEATFEFSQIMDRVRRIIEKVRPHDSIERYTELGVEVITGEARIVSPWEVEVNGRRISARSLIIASGARPLVPAIPGLDQVGYLTSDTVWKLRELPRRLLVLGGGPIGCELAQCFARFGSEVTLVEMAPRLVPREDADAALELSNRFHSEGIKVATGHKAIRVEATPLGGRLLCEVEGKEVSYEFDQLLVSLGRKANVEGFGLDELGVQLAAGGTVAADSLLRTNFPNIFVCGDVTGPFQFTHVAAHQAWYASVNALLAPFWSFAVDYRVIPWATFTDPEVARVGLSEDEARKQGIAVEVTRYGLDDLDRAIADSADHGFVKVLTAPGRDRILGALIVGDHAADLLAEFVLAMKHG
ncbi:MAG: FAD-dependent oxidoreductase, partial [Arenimonas sp.]